MISIKHSNLVTTRYHLLIIYASIATIYANYSQLIALRLEISEHFDLSKKIDVKLDLYGLLYLASNISNIWVSVNPGDTTFTVMPRGAISLANVRQNCSIAALLPK